MDIFALISSIIQLLLRLLPSEKRSAILDAEKERDVNSRVIDAAIDSLRDDKPKT